MIMVMVNNQKWKGVDMRWFIEIGKWAIACGYVPN